MVIAKETPHYGGPHKKRVHIAEGSTLSLSLSLSLSSHFGYCICYFNLMTWCLTKTMFLSKPTVIEFEFVCLCGCTDMLTNYVRCNFDI